MGMPPRPCIEIGFAAIAEQYFVTDKLADQRLERGARNVPQSFEDQKLGSRQRELIAREGDPEYPATRQDAQGIDNAEISQVTSQNGKQSAGRTKGHPDFQGAC